MHGLRLRIAPSTDHPGSMSEGRPVRWNHNIHYHRRILDVVPDGAQTALDVGTGDGLLASELRDRVPHVTGLDLDATALESARGRDTDVTWVQGDVMTVPLPTASFDVVASIATIHHLPDLDLALHRLAELTAPGGVVAVVGLAQNSSPLDYAYEVAGLLQHRHLSRRFGYWEHSAPTTLPTPMPMSDAAQTTSSPEPAGTDSPCGDTPSSGRSRLADPQMALRSSDSRPTT